MNSKPYVNVIVGANTPRKIRAGFDINIQQRLVLHDKWRNVTFDFSEVERTLCHPLNSITKDLLEIAVVVFMADQYVARDENGLRTVSILMPVRHPEVWNQTKRELTQAVTFLTQDHVVFNFWERKDKGDETQIHASNDTNRCVSLLSGGLDSLAGAKYLIDEKENPVFVSHYTGAPQSSQNDLIKFLRTHYGKEFEHCRVFVSKSRVERPLRQLKTPQTQIAVQFSRSFLFLSLATSIAVELGISKIFMFENGPIAMNVPISESRLNTRTAHPAFLDLFKQLVKVVFGLDIQILNPFLYRTKSEITEDLVVGGFRDMIRVATSCWQTGRVQLLAARARRPGFEGRHCGECFPCILRRVAVNNTALTNAEDDTYVFDIFKEYPNLQRETRMTIADLLRFCYDQLTLSTHELICKYPDLSTGSEFVDLQRVVNMYQRHAGQVIRSFNTMGNHRMHTDFSSLLTKS